MYQRQRITTGKTQHLQAVLWCTVTYEFSNAGSAEGVQLLHRNLDYKALWRTFFHIYAHAPTCVIVVVKFLNRAYQKDSANKSKYLFSVPVSSQHEARDGCQRRENWWKQSTKGEDIVITAMWFKEIQSSVSLQRYSIVADWNEGDSESSPLPWR